MKDVARRPDRWEKPKEEDDEEDQDEFDEMEQKLTRKKGKKK